MQETKYGTMPTEDLLQQGMRLGFEIISIVHVSLLSMVQCYSIYIDIYYLPHIPPYSLIRCSKLGSKIKVSES